MSLFAELPSMEMARNATFSRCKQYRYTLSRQWDQGDSVIFIGLNPSTANDKHDDPTVRRCIGFAKSWGFGRLVLVNLFGFRATDPSVLTTIDDPIGPSNDRVIRQILNDMSLVVVAWGTRGRMLERDQRLLSWLPHPYCLGLTKSGFPKHPLYLRADVTPFPLPS